jgi:outer membrane protein assembly factor BamB
VSPDGTKAFVTGLVLGTDHLNDYATLAYDATTGERLWVRRYDGALHRNAEAHALAVSRDGRTVFVTGDVIAGPRPSLTDATVAYDASTGARRWASLYGSGHRGATPQALEVSPDGTTLFLTGYGDGPTYYRDYTTLAYSALTGARRWAKRYDGPEGIDDYPSALAVSPDGSAVFVTGVIDWPNERDYATVAYAAG